MKIRPPGGDDVGFQMAPMIDIVFQLMIFFMCASHIHFTADAPPIEVPVATNASIADDLSNRRFVTVKDNGTILLGGAVVTEKQLREQMTKAVKDNVNIRVFLRADKRLKHKTVRDVMQICAESGIGDIIFAAWQSESR